MEMEKPTETNQGAVPVRVATTNAAPIDSSAAPSNVKRSSFNKTVLLCTVIVALTLLASTVLGAWLLSRDNTKSVGYTGIDSSRYQAVFLSNGQVYFGKLSDSGSELVKLTSIWYLQVQQGTSADALKATDQSQVSLAKLGNELHGPDDSMSISKDQVLFWENLKNDSKVVKTINDAK